MRILYIDVDSLRADHLGCYGYHRRTTPVMDAVAAEGIRFNNYYVSDAPCLPSRTAFYSGRFGIQNGVVGHGGTAAQPKIEGKLRWFRDLLVEQGLAHQLQLRGFHTAMISTFAQRHAAHWFYAGFNEIHNIGTNGGESADEVQPTIDRWLRDHAKEDNWYLHVNYWDPHTPYRVPASFGEPFAKEKLPGWLDDDALIQRHTRMTGPHTALDISMFSDEENPQFPRQPGKITDRASMRRLIDGYDTGVRYVDEYVGRTIAAIKKAGVYEDTAIIISADHGENFGELGIYAEHATADVATCRVPMIVKWPGGGRGVVDNGPHYHLDWAPTLVELVGGNACPIWDGLSFAGSVRGKRSSGRDYLVLGQCAHVCQRSVRWEHWLYVRTYHDGFHLFPDEMLFDVAADPHEQKDLAGSETATCAHAAQLLSQWHGEQMQKMSGGSSDVSDPLWTVIREGGPAHALHDPARSPLPAYLPRLEATGRKDGADELRRRYREFLP
jgi:choline-sulfatase